MISSFSVYSVYVFTLEKGVIIKKAVLVKKGKELQIKGEWNYWESKNLGKLLHDHLPKLNIAIPRPASDSMEIDFSIILGICTCHLQWINLIMIYQTFVNNKL